MDGQGGQLWPSNLTLHKIIQFHLLLGRKKTRLFGKFFSPTMFCIPRMSWPLSLNLDICKMGKKKKLEMELLNATQGWKNLLAWFEKKCESVKNMVCYVHYTIGVFLASYIVDRRNSEVPNDIGLLWHLNVNHKTDFISSDSIWTKFFYKCKSTFFKNCFKGFSN